MAGHILAQAHTAGKYAAALGLQGKEGGGFLDTASRGTQTPAEGDAPSGGVEKLALMVKDGN